MAREDARAAHGRATRLRKLQAEYPTFVPFLRAGMQLLGFSTSEIQEDIGRYMEQGPDDLMVQAQRGEAKTTIASFYAIWCLVHAPKFRILIVSAGGKMANEISTLITRVVLAWEVVEPLRPDRSAGDRTSVEAFDVHHSLKGTDKSPSISCCGITAQLPGKRADLLLCDDVESPKNSMTAGNRELLLHLTLEFSSIVVDAVDAETGERYPGRTIWLGTPQTGESIYNTLPGRGVAVRIWPGRYPTPEQLPLYGDMLAPIIRRKLEADPSLQTGAGPALDQGHATDPLMRSEEALVNRELRQGPAMFQLQFMLNTRLLDADRYPLKTESLICLRLGVDKQVPLVVQADFDPTKLVARCNGSFSFKVSRPGHISAEVLKMAQVAMYIDPAGGGANRDETAYAIGGVVGSTVFVLAAGGFPGGYSKESLDGLGTLAAKWGVQTVVIEKNFGHGAFREVFTPILLQAAPGVAITDDQVGSTQKELRIISILEPIMARRSLVLNSDVLDEEWATAQKYGQREGLTYSLPFQLARLTREKGALVHDDRADALAGLCNFFKKQLTVDADKVLVVAQKVAYLAMIRDPLGYNRYKKRASFNGPKLGVRR
jgi:hypothetical protein